MNEFERPANHNHESEATLRMRLDRMERESRRLRRASTALLVAFAVLVGLGSVGGYIMWQRGTTVGADVVQARRFVLRDGAGRVRAMWGTTDDGSAQLVLQDHDGRPRARLSVLHDGSPGLALVDPDGRARAVLGLLPDETISLVLADRQGRSRAVLGLTAREASSLVFADGRGVTRAGMSVSVDGYATLTLPEYDANGSQ